MKDLHEDNLIDSVRERLGRYEEAPSADLWNKIAASRRKEQRVWPMWLEAASLVGMGMILYSLSFELPTVKSGPASIVENETAPVVSTTPGEIKQIKKAKEHSVTQTKDVLVSHEEVVVQRPHQSSVPGQSSPDPRQSSPEIVKADSVYSPNIQEDISPATVPPYKKPKSKFQLYFAVTPSLAFQKIAPNGNDELIVQGFENRSPVSIKRFGFGIDAGLQRDINNIFGFYGGLSFYHQSQQLTYSYYNKDADVTRVGDGLTFEIVRRQHSKTFDYTMSNLGVNAGLLVTLKGEKLKHKFGAGLLFSQGFAKEAGSYNNRRSSYLSYQLFYRNEVRINDHLSWFVEPTFIYSFFSKENLNEPFVLKPYRAGIRAGVLYRFKG